MGRDQTLGTGGWWAPAACLTTLCIDLVFVTSISGAAALVAMAFGIAWIGGSTGIRLKGMSNRERVRSLLRFEVVVLAACIVLAAGRAVLFYRRIEAGGETAIGHVEVARLYDLFFAVLALSAELVLWRLNLFSGWLLRLGRRPPLLLAGSFAVMIAVGTLLLCLPWSVRELRDVSILDSLFTMTSAVCVTGLTVNELGTHYTTFGQVVVLLGIQFGGIGIMTLGAAAVSFSRTVPLRAQAGYARLHEAGSLRDLRHLVRTVVGSTFAIEAIGAVLLWLAWRDDPRLEGHSVAWFAVFHAISAFCNAGFSLWPDNVASFVDSGSTQLVLAVLIVSGGLGFPVYLEIGRRVWARVRAVLGRRRYERRRFGIGVRVVVVVTPVLIVAGMLVIGGLEWTNSLSPLEPFQKFMAALFSSVTTRTAGFNTLDFGAMRTSTLLVVMALMWIGGSPGSTAGGIKTSTAAVLFATFVSELRGHEPRLHGRSLAPETIRRATAVAAMSMVIVGLVLFALTLTETHPILPLAFESVSAFATVGLSMGITSQLSDAGRMIIILAMFVGRLGPMTIALAVGGRQTRETFRLPSQEIAIW